MRPVFDVALVTATCPRQQRLCPGRGAPELSYAYEPGERSDGWTKMRVNRSEEFVIGGYTIGGGLECWPHGSTRAIWWLP
jgi:hypothetical protein